MGTISKDWRVNNQIRSKRVRLISESGGQLGIVSITDALRVAAEKDLDLVEVAPNANPSVCRVMDYGKFKYEQSKKEKEARKRQKTVSLKELRMSPKIDDHDFEVRVRRAREFLDDGDKVKVTIRFRGREIVHQNLAAQRLRALADELKECASVERPPRLEGRSMAMVLTPKNDQGKEGQGNA